MINLAEIPTRQKITIGITVITGLLLLAIAFFDWMNPEPLNLLIFGYGICVPLFLIATDNIIDLNNKSILLIWFGLAIILLIISLLNYNNDYFLIRRSENFDEASGINRFIARHSTSSLKALFACLCVYWVFNRILNQRGLFFINTSRQPNCNHNEAGRKITGADVLMNIFLYFFIVAAALIGW